MSAMDSEKEIPPVVGRYFDSLAAGDNTALKSCFSHDARWIAPGQLPNSGTWEGPEAIVDVFFPIAAGRMVPGSFSIQPVSITTGPGNTVVEWKASAITLTGDVYENSYIANLVIDNDRIVEVREYCDTQRSEILFR